MAGTSPGAEVKTQRTIRLNVSHAPQNLTNRSFRNNTGSLQQYWQPKIEFPESVTVQEGLCVLVPCSFSYPWTSWSANLYIYWFRDGDSEFTDDPVATNKQDRNVNKETQGRFQVLRDPQNNCSLSIIGARKKDQGTYFFRVERGRDKYSYTGKKLKLSVTVQPDIQFGEPLVSGHPTNLTCVLVDSCKWATPQFSWEGDALDSLDPRSRSSSVLSFTPRAQDHGRNVTCRVTVPGALVNTQRTIRLNVSYAPQNLTIHSLKNNTAPKILQNTSSLIVLEDQALGLLCEADSNPPAKVSWFRGSPAVNDTPISNSSTLELLSVGSREEEEFTCRAENSLGFQLISLSLCVAFAPHLQGPSCSWQEELLNCNCSSQACPAPILRWLLGDQTLGVTFNDTMQVNVSSWGSWVNGSLSLRGGLGADLRLSCEAQNTRGIRSATTQLLRVKTESLENVIPAALGGAGVMALLCLALCLLFFGIVKVHRSRAARRQEVKDDEDLVMGTVAWGSRQQSQSDGPPDQMSPNGEVPASGEPQELYYANLSFHGLKPRDPQAQQDTSTTEYSEIKTGMLPTQSVSGSQEKLGTHQ